MGLEKGIEHGKERCVKYRRKVLIPEIEHSLHEILSQKVK